MVSVGVCESLPVTGVSMILRNDLAGDKVMSLLKVCELPTKLSEPRNLGQH